MASYNVYHILLSYIMCMSYIIDHNVWYDTLSYTVKTLDSLTCCLILWYIIWFSTSYHNVSNRSVSHYATLYYIVV